VDIKLNGIGVVAPFGNGLDNFKNANNNANKKRSDHIGTIPTIPIDDSLGFPYFKASTREINDFFSSKQIRRIDHFSKMALLAASLAIENAGFQLGDIKEKKIGVILATGHGAMNSTYAFKDSINKRGDSFASPIFFSKSIHNASMANLTIQLGIKGPNLTISQHSFSFQSAMLTACTWINEGICDQVLMGGADEFCETLGYCIERFKEEPGAKTSLNNVYNTKSIPGEGASFFLLSSSCPDHENNHGSISEIKTGNIRYENIVFEKDTCLLLDSSSDKTKTWIIKNSKNKILNINRPHGDFFTNPGFDLITALLELKNHSSITLFNIDDDDQFFLIQIGR